MKYLLLLTLYCTTVIADDYDKLVQQQEETIEQEERISELNQVIQSDMRDQIIKNELKILKQLNKESL